jgi:flagellum-specific peptidoglycan hydrolase FlgJ
MALQINDPYGGGQDAIGLGQSRITPRESYGVDARGLREEYADRMKSVNQLTDSLARFQGAVGEYQKKQDENDLKEVPALAASIVNEINGNSPIKDQVTALLPQATPLQQARAAETIGIMHGTTQANKIIQEVTTDPNLRTPEEVSAALNKRLAAEAERVGKEHFYGPSYLDTMNKLFLQRSQTIAAERVKNLEKAAEDGLGIRLDTRVDDVLSGRQRVEASGEIEDVSGKVDTATAQRWAQFGPMDKVEGFVIHHTGGRGSVEGVVQTFKQRNFPAHFVIDREGKVYQVLPDNMRGQHIEPGEKYAAKGGKAPTLSNRNSLGVEIIANDDKDVLPVQVDAARKLVSTMAAKHGFSANAVYGHGEVNPGHKQPDEGMSTVSLIRTKGLDTADISNFRTSFQTDIYKRARDMGIPEPQAKLAAAQASVESAEGRSELASKSNNIFGVKAGADWTGDRVTHRTKERATDGSVIEVDADFRKYADPNESLKDWWAKLQKNYPAAASASTLDDAINGLFPGPGRNYATTPKDEYAKALKGRLGARASLDQPNVVVASNTTTATDATSTGRATTGSTTATSTGTTVETDPTSAVIRADEAVGFNRSPRAVAIRQILDQEDARFLVGQDDPEKRKISKARQISTLVNAAEKYGDPSLLDERQGAINWDALSKDERDLLRKSQEQIIDRQFKMAERKRVAEERKKAEDLITWKNGILDTFRKTGEIDFDSIKDANGLPDHEKRDWAIALQKSSEIPETTSARNRDNLLDKIYNAGTIGNYKDFADDNKIAEAVNSGKQPTVAMMRDYILNRDDISPTDRKAILDKLEAHMSGSAVLQQKDVQEYYTKRVASMVTNTVGNEILGPIVLMKRPDLENEMQDIFERHVRDSVKDSITSTGVYPIGTDLRKILDAAREEVRKEMNGVMTSIGPEVTNRSSGNSGGTSGGTSDGNGTTPFRNPARPANAR